MYRRLLDRISSGGAAVLVTLVTVSAGSLTAVDKVLLSEEDLRSPDTGIAGEGEGMEWRAVARSALESGAPQFVRGAEDQAVLAEPYYPEPRLLILGGGHITLPLADFGAQVGFRVTVVDDRPFFASRARFPAAAQVVCTPFEDCLAPLAPDAYSFVVIVTRGHRHDLTCLRQALHYPLPYLGMMGSRRRVKEMRELLVAEGVEAGVLAGVCAPIGLPIGAVTPEEIAVSILAQLVSVRRMGQAPPGGLAPAPVARLQRSEFDRALLEELAGETDAPRAIVTVVQARGSTPRAAGAKMLAWPDGRTLGSIGGGCAEAEALGIGRQVAVTGRCQTLQVDLTADAADDEGMACGGCMELLIEAVGQVTSPPAPLAPPP